MHQNKNLEQSCDSIQSTPPADAARVCGSRAEMNDPCLKFIEVGTGKAVRRIAVRQRAGVGPALLWLGGFKSDMKGTKAEALDRWARETGRGITRFDYSGHGESGGEF